MTVGELLTAFPWVAPVEVWTPCGVDEDGSDRFEVAWSETLILDPPKLPAEIAAKEIRGASVFHIPSENLNSLVSFQIYTK